MITALLLVLALQSGEAPQVGRFGAETAELRPLGFPLWTSEDGKLPRTFVYAESRPFDTWKSIPGRFTRHGDVRELLDNADDLYVIMAPGDELAVDFDVSALPEPAPGMTRTWLVYGLGYVKDVDLHTPGSAHVNPIPFADMESWPPPPGSYAADPRRAEVAERYNTRIHHFPELFLAGAFRFSERDYFRPGLEVRQVPRTEVGE